MDLLEQFIRLEIEEGKKLNALALFGLGVLGANRYGEKLASELPSTPEISRQYRKSYDDLLRDMGATDTSTKTKERKHQTRAVPRPAAGEAKSYSRDELLGFVTTASSKYDVPPAFVDAIIKTESNYDPQAESPAGAQGIMQIMPATARSIGLDDPWDAKKSIDAGTKHLKQLLDRFDNDYELAAAAYNSGVGNVEKYDGVPPFDETQKYVKSVKKRMETSAFAQSEE